jgi:hypothetical protein
MTKVNTPVIDPPVGTVRKGTELGFEGSKQYRRYILAQCPHCGEARWAEYIEPFRVGKVRLCQTCNKRQAKRSFRINPANYDQIPEEYSR